MCENRADVPEVIHELITILTSEQRFKTNQSSGEYRVFDCGMYLDKIIDEVDHLKDITDGPRELFTTNILAEIFGDQLTVTFLIMQYAGSFIGFFASAQYHEHPLVVVQKILQKYRDLAWFNESYDIEESNERPRKRQRIELHDTLF